MINRQIGFPVPKFSEIIHNFFLIFIFYIYIFQPPLISKNIYIGFELVFFVVFIAINGEVFYSFVRKFKREVALLVIIILYSVTRDLFVGQEVYAFRFSAWVFQSFAFGYLIVHHIESRGKKSNYNVNIFTVIYWTVFVAALFTFLLLTNKSLDIFYKSIAKDEYYEMYESFESRYRAFGIAENLSFTYSYVLGFFAGYTMLVIRRNYLLIIPFLLFLLGVYFNARIGFAAVLFFFLYSAFIERKWLNLLITFVLGMMVVIFLVSQFDSLSSLLKSNQDWVSSAFYDVTDSFLGTNYSSAPSTIETLTSNFIVMPDSFAHWIFGNGESLFGRTDVQSSDNGYILQLNYGGLMLLCLIIYLMIYLSRRLSKVLGWKHWFTFVFIMSIVILNFKGFLFAATPGGRLLFFLYVYFIDQFLYRKNSSSIAYSQRVVKFKRYKNV